MNLRKKGNNVWYKKWFPDQHKKTFRRKNRKNLTTNLELITLLRYKFLWRDMNECGNCLSPTFLLAHSCEMLPEKGHYRKKIIVNQIDDRHVWAKTEGIGMIREKSTNVQPSLCLLFLEVSCMLAPFWSLSHWSLQYTLWNLHEHSYSSLLSFLFPLSLLIHADHQSDLQ